jgi:hypothetical protein
MSGIWKDLWDEVVHHFAHTIVFLVLLVLDFLPVVALFGFMRLSEWLTERNHYIFFYVPLESIMNHIEVAVLITFMALGGYKVALRLYMSIQEMRKVKPP